MPNRIAAALVLLACLAATRAQAQKTMKPWTEWSKKDVQKILDDSPWGQTQTETDTSEMFYRPTTPGQGAAPVGRAGASSTSSPDSLGSGRASEGALNQSVGVKYHIQWFSSRAIRRALARQIVLRQGTLTPELREFADGPSDKRAVIAVTFEAADQRFGAKVLELFNAAAASTLKNTTYLERRDGTRVFLQDYVPPSGNRLGAALFVFPRTVHETALLGVNDGDVRFVSEVAPALRLNMKFKVADMIYEGQLDY